MAISLEATQRLAEIRRKVLEGVQTNEDLREGMAILRQDRKLAAATSAGAKASKAPVDTTGLLANLKALAQATKGTVIPPA